MIEDLLHVVGGRRLVGVHVEATVVLLHHLALLIAHRVVVAVLLQSTVTLIALYGWRQLLGPRRCFLQLDI